MSSAASPSVLSQPPVAISSAPAGGNTTGVSHHEGDIVDADEWDDHLEGARGPSQVVCLDKTACRTLYVSLSAVAEDDMSQRAEMMIKVISPPSPVPNNRVLGAARERCERLSSSEVSTLADGNGHITLDGGGVGVFLHCYTGAAVDSRGRLIGQGPSLRDGSRSLLDIIAFARPALGVSRQNRMPVASARGKVSFLEVASILRLAAGAIDCRLVRRERILSYSERAVQLTDGSGALIHGNLSASNIFISPAVGRHGLDDGIHITLTDPLDGFTFPMQSTDCSAFSLGHLAYIERHVVAPSVRQLLAGGSPTTSLAQEMHLRYEEHPYIPSHFDDVCALGALAFYMLAGHPFRHGLTVAEAAVSESLRDEVSDNGSGTPLVCSLPTSHSITRTAGFSRLLSCLTMLSESSGADGHAFFSDALDFVCRTLLVDTENEEHRAVMLCSVTDALNHPFLQFGVLSASADIRLQLDATRVRHLLTEAESNIETFKMFAGSGPLRVRPMRNIHLNESAAVFSASFDRLSSLSPLQRLALLFPSFGQGLDLLSNGHPPLSISDALSPFFPSAAVTVEMGTGTLIIDGGDGLDWSVSEADLCVIGCVATLQDYLIRLNDASARDEGLEVRAVALQLVCWAFKLFPQSTVGAADGGIFCNDGGTRGLPTNVPNVFSTFINSVVIRNCKRCSLSVLCPLETVRVENVSDCRLFFGPSRSSLITNAFNCEPIAIASEFLALEGDITDCVLSLHLADNPRCSSVDMRTLYARALEEDRLRSSLSGGDAPLPSTEVRSGEEGLLNVQFIPYVVSYEGCSSHFNRIGLLREYRATLLNFPAIDVMRDRQMFDLSGPREENLNCRIFGSQGFFFDFYARHGVQSSPVTRGGYEQLLNETLCPIESLASLTALEGVGDQISASSYAFPVQLQGLGGFGRLLSDYPFLPTIAHGMIYRHSGKGDLYIAPGEATNWSIRISDVHGQASGRVDGQCSALATAPLVFGDPARSHLLTSLHSSLLTQHGDSSLLRSPLTKADEDGLHHDSFAAGGALNPLILILEAVDDVSISNVSCCTIVVAASASTITCTNVHKSSLYLISKCGIVLNGCSKLDVVGYCSEVPCRIDSHLNQDDPHWLSDCVQSFVDMRSLPPSRQLHLRPLLLEAPQLEDILEMVGLTGSADDGTVLLPRNAFCEGSFPQDSAIYSTSSPTEVYSIHIPYQSEPSGVMVECAQHIGFLQRGVPTLPITPYVDLEAGEAATPKSSLVVIHDLVDCSVLRMQGAMSPLRHAFDVSKGVSQDRWLTIAHVDGGVIHVADSVQMLYVAHCTGPLDIIVAASQTVVIDSCQGVTLQTSCFDFLATNCHNCHFALHVNSQPKVDDGYSYWGDALALESVCASYGVSKHPRRIDYCGAVPRESPFVTLSHSSSNLRFSALNITCDAFESLMEAAFVQMSPNLYDQPVLVRLPPPVGIRAYFSACELFLSEIRVPLPTFASPPRHASSGHEWGIARSDTLDRGRVRGCDVIEPCGGGGVFSLDFSDTPLVSPFGFSAHSRGLYSQCLDHLCRTLQRHLSTAHHPIVTSTELNGIRALLEPLFGRLPRSCMPLPPSSFGIIEESDATPDRRAKPPAPAHTDGDSLQCPGFDQALLVAAPLQGTAVGGIADVPFSEILVSRVTEDTTNRFEPLLRFLAVSRWDIEVGLITQSGGEMLSFDRLAENIKAVVLSGMEGDPFDEIRRLSLLLLPTVLDNSHPVLGRIANSDIARGLYHLRQLAKKNTPRVEEDPPFSSSSDFVPRDRYSHGDSQSEGSASYRQSDADSPPKRLSEEPDEAGTGQPQPTVSATGGVGSDEDSAFLSEPLVGVKGVPYKSARGRRTIVYTSEGQSHLCDNSLSEGVLSSLRSNRRAIIPVDVSREILLSARIHEDGIGWDEIARVSTRVGDARVAFDESRAAVLRLHDRQIQVRHTLESILKDLH